MKNETKWPDVPFECDIKVTFKYTADPANRFALSVERGDLRGSDSNLAKSLQGGIMAAIAHGVEIMFHESDCSTTWEE